MDNGKIRFKIYGVRGSYPPTNGDITRFGVNTTSVRFDIDHHVVIIDAGTGIINLGSDLIQEIKAGKSQQNLFKLHLMFTHTHIDHLMGFPYFSMIYLPQSEFHVIAPRMNGHTIEEVLDLWMSPVFFPVTLSELPSRFHYHDFGESRVVVFFENDFRIVSVNELDQIDNWIGKISCIRNYTHPKGGTYIYKIENPQGRSVVFATDIEGFIGGDQRLIKFARNADILLHDAQYSLEEYRLFQGFGHSTYEMACDVAKQAKVKKLILSHHDPKHTDKELSELENRAQDIFPETYMATESMEFVL
ncbi:MAG: MBL fold metallo-hydrolase [Calditrichia bacterium]